MHRIAATVLLSIAMPAVSSAEPTPQRATISITRQGFEPDKVPVQKDRAITLAFTRKTDATCAKQVVIELGDGKKITKDLPLDKTVEVRAVFHKTGELRYACGMDMVHGVLSVQ